MSTDLPQHSREGADPIEPLLTPGEVARLFRVDPKTVARWAKTGKIGCVRTLGGHRRFRESEVREMLTMQAGGSEI